LPLRNTGRPVGRSIPWIAAVAVFLIHLIANPHYGFFRDELYFIICGRHPQFGYVDQPPIVPLLSALSQLFGHSLVLLRAIPAFFAAAGVYTTCLLVVEYGGGAFAQVLASIVFFFTPVLTNFGMKVSPDSVGLWTWPLLALFLLRLAKGADARLWPAIGLVAGLSIESKYSVVFFLFAMLLGLLLTPQRRILFNGWFVAACGLAVIIALPNFLWQWHHDLPMLELLKNGQLGKNVLVGPLFYIGQETIITGLLFAAVWLIGLVWLLSKGELRFFGYAYLILIVEMIAFHGKHYYPADVYPILIAAGAVPLESWTTTRPAVRALLTAAAVVWGIAVVPYNLPVLPEHTFVVYSASFERMIHLSRSATATEAHREDSALPGDWADMHGWPEMAASAKSVYESLPVAERARAVVFAGNYGEASAIEFFTPGIPVISEHNQYWLWGTRGFRGDTLVQVGGSCFQSLNLYASRTRAATFTHPWAIGYETNLPIWICRGIKKPFSTVWTEIKAYE
jgi:hypothetical protein